MKDPEDQLLRAFELGYSQGWEAGFKEGSHMLRTQRKLLESKAPEQPKDPFSPEHYRKDD